MTRSWEGGSGLREGEDQNTSSGGGEASVEPPMLTGASITGALSDDSGRTVCKKEIED